MEQELHNLTLKYMEDTDIEYRKSLGQYFTPKSVREQLLSKLPNQKVNPKVLDPGCGTAEFLITAKKYFINPQLYGWDIDRKLIQIAKKILPTAHLEIKDALTEHKYEQYDFVIGNPPYYEFPPSQIIKQKFGNIINGRTNIFSLFIQQGINSLKHGGYLAYVVPPSMNNGAYFSKLRKFIVENCNIESLTILEEPDIFHKALQKIMLIVLKKGRNNGDYIFKKNNILIFSERANYLKKAFDGKKTLHDLGYRVKTGRLVWNQNKNLLTNSPKGNLPLIWAHNITSNGLKVPLKHKKPQYVKINDYDTGPAIVVNRITGAARSAKLKAGIIPKGMRFIAENHVNVIFPPSGQIEMPFENTKREKVTTLQNLLTQLKSEENLKVIQNITGNTQVSKTELENLFPVHTRNTSPGRSNRYIQGS